MTGFSVIEVLPSHGAPYALPDPFMMVHEARPRLAEALETESRL